MYDPVKRAEKLEEIVSERDLRRYYRFRPAKWYGGIVTGDVTGCNLLCHFCWAGDEIRNDPAGRGTLYSPSEAFEKMDSIGRKKKMRQMRLSGQEPTIGREHLLDLLGLVERSGRFKFILETNGILLGHDPSYSAELGRFSCLEVRVSLKGCDNREFSSLTGAKPAGFDLQIEALSYLSEAGVEVWPAIMISFSNKKSVEKLVHRIAAIDRDLAKSIEIEELILYPHVSRRLKRKKIEFGKGHDPSDIPEHLI
jgi:uncharacterized Fe-S cluster-containing radical SAM superfamily protein